MQQFHSAVRNSPEVKFAVQAFAALNSNNFVRFFKLVQSASYLNACLLHCYFNQVSIVAVLEGKGHALGNTLLVQMREVSSEHSHLSSALSFSMGTKKPESKPHAQTSKLELSKCSLSSVLE